MSTKSFALYRNGRKFYVTAEEYQRRKSEEQIQRRAAILKSQNLPTTHANVRLPRSISTSSYAPVQRHHSNPYEYKYEMLRTPYVPSNTLAHFDSRPAQSRLSRSPVRKSENFDDLSSVNSSVITKTRSHSSDKILDRRQSDQENEIKRSPSTETTSTSKFSPARRPVPTTISDYGTGPTNTFSMTPNDQSHSQTTRSKMRNYFVGIKPSSLNPSSKSSTSAYSGTGSIFESGAQGSDHLFTVLGSSNRRLARTHSPSDFLSTNDYSHPRDTASGISFADENSRPLLSLIQRRHTELSRPKHIDSDVDDVNQIRHDLWTRSTIRSQSSDGLIEKKRVRFADTEGLLLESNPLRSPNNPRLLNRRIHVRNASDSSRGQAQPFQTALHQPTTKRNENRLATDV